MERSYPDLFSPMMVRGKLFRNRIISAPIGAWTFSPESHLFDYAIDMFRAKALGGAAAVTVGHTEVNAHEPDSDGFGMYFDLRGPEGTAALSEFADAVRAQGCHVSIELNYGGVVRFGDPNGLYYGPSPLQLDDGATVREMDQDKIDQTIRQYTDCALRMKRSGFDMVTIHAAHGWLPEQFLSRTTNRRTDRYGGSLENRMRFPLELIHAIRQAVGDDMLIEYRMGGVDPAAQPEVFQDTLAFVRRAEEEIDILHLSTGMDAPRERSIPNYYLPPALNLPYARAMKDAGVQVPIAIVGALSDPDTADRAIREGTADFVAIGRGLVADPDLPRKAQLGRTGDIRPCIRCMHCLTDMHQSHIITCTVNPRAGHEHRVPAIAERQPPKRVVVIGGGPAGMQGAVAACDRGHQVTLVERSGQLGGLLNMFPQDPHKRPMSQLRDYLVGQVEGRDIQVMLNTCGSPALAEAMGADAVLVAVGGRPRMPSIPGIDRVLTAQQAYQHPERLGQRVAIIGGNLGGCELAIYLKGLGRRVTVAERRDRLFADANMAVAQSIATRLDGVELLPGWDCTAVTQEGVLCAGPAGERLVSADSVVVAAGLVAPLEGWTGYLSSALQVIPIGDCRTVSDLYGAIHSGFYAALEL